MKIQRLVTLVAFAIVAASTQGQTGSGYKITKKVKVGGEGGWDYLSVDSAARRLYVTRGTHVMVFDADSLASVGEIANTSGVHGVALAPDLGRGFASNGKASTVTIFDLKTLKTIDEVKVTGENPDAILYDPASKQVFAFNGRTSNATILDAATGKVVATLALGGKPEFATTDLSGHVFVNIEDKSEVVEIDSRKPAVLAHWPLAPCQEPSGMAIDRAHKRIFSGCDNKMMAVVDTGSGKVVATAPRARTMALDEKTHRVYLVTAEFGAAPEPTAETPHPRPPMVPDTFTILVLDR